MAYTLLGKDFVPPDVRAKVTGQARYAEDFRADGMLFCRLLTSPVPHARVRNADLTEALDMEGVVAVLTADEVPSFDAPAGPILTNEPLFVGDPILALAAVDETTAQNAIERIRLDLEPLPFTVDPLQSLYPGGPNARSDANVASAMSGALTTVKWNARDFAAVSPGQLPMGDPVEEWSFGDIDAGFADAALVLDETFVTAGVSHHSMEPRSAMAYWQNGKCYLHGSTQSQTAVMPDLPGLLGVGLDDIVYIAEYCGGGFGSKARAYPVMAIPALMAKKAQRPVMLRISRAEEFYVGSARPGFQGRIKMGFRADGRVTAVDLYIVQENGPYSGFDDFDAAASAVTLLYQPLSMRFRAVPVQTNTPPRGAMRGPGENQIAVAVEPLIDKAAADLGLDRLAIRRINAADNNAKYYADQGPVTSAYQREALEMGAEAIDWSALLARSGQRQGPKVIGIGVGQAFHPAGRNGYDGLVRVAPDGKLHIHSGAGNLGTYSHTGTSRVAAEILKCNWDNCVVERGDSRKHLPWSPTQSGSNTSFTMTRQNYVAAMDALAKLKEIAALEFGGAPEDFDVADERVFKIADPAVFLSYAAAAQRAIDLGGRYSGHEMPDDIHDITKSAVRGLAGTGLIGVAKDNIERNGLVAGISVGFVEIELDLETGKYDILRYLGISDCGTVLHPQSLASQIKGGAVQGFGMAASERHIFDPQNGLPGTVGLLQCKPPSYLDVPAVMQAAAVGLIDPQNPVGAKGMGEPPLGCAAAALVCAISDALGGVYFNRAPIVPDMIVNALAGLPQSHEPLQVNTA
ncbi:MAG TPA: xanthine dehydrogenase family protein molybdopterin-binding subunit [Gammaproteobacteria bacterium]|jgi:CO/xanthine dehydrogenase Mo-binding subunit